jgi:glycosyltransferase involved in cell wall biosynthesis
VLIVSSHFPPDRSAGTHRVLRLANHLQMHGWSTWVLTIAPEYYRGSIQRDDALAGRAHDGIAVVRTGAWRGATRLLGWRNALAPRRHGGPARSPEAARRAAPQSWRAWRKQVTTALFGFPDDEVGWLLPAVARGVGLVRRHRIDTVLTSAPPFTCHLIGHALRSLTGARWVADFRDPWSRAPWGRPGSARAHRFLEARVVARADGVVLNTPELHREFSEWYGPAVARKFRVVTNGYDAALVDPWARVVPPEPPPLVLTHAGNLYGARDPLPLLEGLARCLRDGRVPPGGLRLAFVGKVAASFDIEAAIRRLALTGVVSVTPPVAHDTALGLLAASHVLVVIQPDTALQVPAKLYEYIGLRRPILALAEAGAVARVVREGHFGLVVPPADAEAIAGALTTLYERRGRLVADAAANTAVEAYDARVQSQVMADLLGALTPAVDRPVGAAAEYSDSRPL